MTDTEILADEKLSAKLDGPFTCDAGGRIVYVSVPYPNLSCGTTATGLARAAAFAAWLNACFNNALTEVTP